MSLIKAVSAIFVLALVASCASHPASDPSLSAKDNAMVSSEPMSFTPEGSDGQKIPGLSTIHFAYDSAVVSGSEAKLVEQDAEWIKSHANVKMQIEGHCDQRGSTEYNLALGERRAKTIYRALVEQGIAKNRLSIISYGEERPLVQGDSEEAYAQNRRANFVPLNAPMNKLSATDSKW